MCTFQENHGAPPLSSVGPTAWHEPSRSNYKVPHPLANRACPSQDQASFRNARPSNFGTHFYGFFELVRWILWVWAKSKLGTPRQSGKYTCPFLYLLYPSVNCDIQYMCSVCVRQAAGRTGYWVPPGENGRQVWRFLLVITEQKFVNSLQFELLLQWTCCCCWTIKISRWLS